MSATLDRQALEISIERVIQDHRKRLVPIATTDHDRVWLGRECDRLRNEIVALVRGER